MGEWVKLTAEDGQQLRAYVARPDGKAKGAVVVLQEIFGVNSQIRQVADEFAAEGYVGIAPALFDRTGETGVELKDSGDDLKRAYELYGKLSPDTALKDLAAAYKFVEGEGISRIAVVGFCFGGLLAWLSTTRGTELGISPVCAAGYYPGGVGQVAEEQPSCPVMLHFGAADSHIGADQREAVQKAHPEVHVFVYEGAEHAFAGTERAAYDPKQAGIANERTSEFLRKNLQQ